jgi:hypothetical protein
MRVDEIARKTRLGALSAEQDICSLLFSHKKTQAACRLFIVWLKAHKGRVSPKQVSRFSLDLQEGKVREGFTYSRVNFYRTVFRRLVELGFVTRLYTRTEGWIYLTQQQPIPRKAPGGRNFWNLSWQICNKWNQEWQ